MRSTQELFGTVGAGAAGALLAALLVGASLLLVLPAVAAVGAIALVTTRMRRDQS